LFSQRCDGNQEYRFVTVDIGKVINAEIKYHTKYSTNLSYCVEAAPGWLYQDASMFALAIVTSIKC